MICHQYYHREVCWAFLQSRWCKKSLKKSIFVGWLIPNLLWMQNDHNNVGVFNFTTLLTLKLLVVEPVLYLDMTEAWKNSRQWIPVTSDMHWELYVLQVILNINKLWYYLCGVGSLWQTVLYGLRAGVYYNQEKHFCKFWYYLNMIILL